MPSNQKPKKPIVDERPEPGERGARRTIILICAVLVISVVIFGIIQASRQPAAVVEPSTPVPTETSGALVVREDSRRLNDAPDATGVFPKKWRRSLCREFVDVSES